MIRPLFYDFIKLPIILFFISSDLIYFFDAVICQCLYVFSNPRKSSSVISPFLLFLYSSIASRRMLRIAIFAFSASF